MIPSGFPTDDEIARLSARMLLEVGAVHFNARTPFTHASGKQAPTYIDCRKLISYPRIRSILMDFMALRVMRVAGVEAFVALNGAQFYGLTPNAATVTLVKGTPVDYPAQITTAEGPVTVFDPGFPLHWRVEG